MQPQSRRWWVLGVTCLALVMVNLDLTVVNVALPRISAALHAGTSDLQWIVDAYSLALAGVMLPAGLIGDRLGRRRVMLVGLALFLAASLGCALSASAGELIAARALMGFSAAIVFPISLAVVSPSFGDAERPKAIGILMAAIAIGLPLGPVVGGVLLQHFAWSSVFWINVPAVGIALAAAAVVLPESRNPQAPPLDAVGALLGVAAVTCLVWGMIDGPERGWTAPATWAVLLASALLMAAFVLREHRAAHPLVDPALFRDRRFLWGTVASINVSVALYAILFALPQFLQGALGDDPITAGLRLLPMMTGLLVAGGLGGLVTRAAGTKLAVAAGLALLGGGLATLSQVHLATGYVVVAAGLALCGLGTGAAMTAAMDAVMGAAGGDEAGAGASVNSTLRQIGGALAVAVLGGVLAARYSAALHPALTGLPAAQAAAAGGSIAQAAALAGHLPAGAGLLRAAGTAFADGMDVVMLICMALTALTVVVTLWFLPGRSRSPRAERADRAA